MEALNKLMSTNQQLTNSLIENAKHGGNAYTILTSGGTVKTYKADDIKTFQHTQQKLNKVPNQKPTPKLRRFFK